MPPEGTIQCLKYKQLPYKTYQRSESVTVCKSLLTMEKPCYNAPMFNKPVKVNTMKDFILAVFFFALIGVLLALGV